jgi:hypothetical protein
MVHSSDTELKIYTVTSIIKIITGWQKGSSTKEHGICLTMKEVHISVVRTLLFHGLFVDHKRLQCLRSRDV